jgi:pimeloyl-ACP methyl ester carboxylesterase
MIHRTLLLALLLFAALAPARAQATLEDRFFDSNGVRIRYVEAGRGDAVVLIHGFSLSLDQNWGQTGVIDSLAKDFHVVALDCRGHGKSDKPHDAASYGMQMVEDVARLLDHLKIRKAHVAGYSMGGGIAGKFVVEHPDRVLTAVFGGSAPRIWTAANERLTTEIAESLEQGKGLRPVVLAITPPNQPRPSEEEIEQASRRALGSNDPLALAAVMRGTKQQAVTPDQVGALRMPLLAVIGSADPLKAGVDAFKRLKPELKVVVIEGAAHDGAAGRAEFAAVVREFLVAHRASTGNPGR